MAVESFTITTLDRSEVLRYLGYAGQEISPELDARIDEGMARALEVGRPRGVWRVFDVAGRDGGDNPVVHLAGTALVLRGHDIAEHLDGAVAVGVFAVTAGMGIDQEIRRLSLIDPLAQTVFDVAGSTLVERAADAVEARLVGEAAARGQYVNWRFSPGYGDLPLDIQPVVLRTLDATRQLGITLTPTNLMVPTKSVTAVIGFFEEPQASRKVTCQYCYCKEFCTIRASGRTCHG
ncbi:MAG: vitamin B12 dependent-methionine synthase activation domain-containing protein [Olegusella sp.]|nr:vitamin B12 dependent-methionine synthase activation domain-containing protein [Olegusella sp.]